MQFKKLYETKLSLSIHKKGSDGGRIFLKKDIMNLLSPDEGTNNVVVEVFEINGEGERILIISNINRSSDLFDSQIGVEELLLQIHNLVEENNNLLNEIKEK